MALILLLACCVLLFLIFGQGAYLFALESEVEQRQQEVDIYQEMLEISYSLLNAELRIPFDLAVWEQSQLEPKSVPVPLQSKYRSWNSVRLSKITRASTEWRRLREKHPENLEISARASELQGYLLDLRARYKGRLREGVLRESERE